MKKKRYNRNKKKREQRGLRVEVRHNNIEFALKKFKRMVKDSGMMLELKKRTYYEKPSAVNREKKSTQQARYRYQEIKNGRNY
jgi:small subunit ribosomal protein S21